MKICPQCRSVFGDDFLYCSNDGSILVGENMSLPTEDAEAETVIRRRGEPIIVDFNSPPETQAETVEMNYAALPQSQPIIVEKTSNSKFYALFLIVGLLLGGGLVLATLLAAGIINHPNETNISVQTRAGDNKTQKAENTTERDTEVDKLADELHQKRIAAKPDEDFNGRVIAQNAYVRAVPRSSSNQVDILPVDDRIEIERRENSGSPWYYITCEHGIGGWMHGNTIEFTDGNF